MANPELWQNVLLSPNHKLLISQQFQRHKKEEGMDNEKNQQTQQTDATKQNNYVQAIVTLVLQKPFHLNNR